MFSFQTADSVKFQIQKAMRERDQANNNTMQIRSDFEKLLLQSNQVKIVICQKIESYHSIRVHFNFVINWVHHKIV